MLIIVTIIIIVILVVIIIILITITIIIIITRLGSCLKRDPADEARQAKPAYLDERYKTRSNCIRAPPCRAPGRGGGGRRRLRDGAGSSPRRAGS